MNSTFREDNILILGCFGGLVFLYALVFFHFFLKESYRFHKKKNSYSMIDTGWIGEEFWSSIEVNGPTFEFKKNKRNTWTGSKNDFEHKKAQISFLIKATTSLRKNERIQAWAYKKPSLQRKERETVLHKGAPSKQAQIKRKEKRNLIQSIQCRGVRSINYLNTSWIFCTFLLIHVQLLQKLWRIGWPS